MNEGEHYNEAQSNKHSRYYKGRQDYPLGILNARNIGFRLIGIVMKSIGVELWRYRCGKERENNKEYLKKAYADMVSILSPLVRFWRGFFIFCRYF